MHDQRHAAAISVPIWQQGLALAVGPGLVMALEARQWWAGCPDQRTWQSILFGMTTGWWWAWLLLLPIAWLLGTRDPLHRWQSGWLGSPIACFASCFVLGAGIAAGCGWGVRDLPHPYHDEYSYRFQAQTFLAGRLAFPEPDHASVLDQMHILNSGVFVSRYFPGVGLWLMPFEHAGQPVIGWWLLNGLITGLLALAGHRFSPLAGYATGCLCACSPGMVALGNLILSPQPTMLGMAIFLWAFPAIVERRGWIWPLLAGLGIGYAFLCRPLTASGLGLPYALYSLYRAGSCVVPRYAGRLAVLIASFSLSIVALGLYNRAITGDALTSPYGVYTATRTPNHVYGFYNRTRGSVRENEHPLRAYDEWSQDLTPRLAVELLVKRVSGLLRWSAGLPLVACLGSLALLQMAHADDRVLLLALSIIGLMAAYVPFGFEGLLGWGYLFEAMPPLFLLLGWAAGRLCDVAANPNRAAICRWWLGMLALMISSMAAQTLPDVFAPQRELVYPRLQAKTQADLERKAAQNGPILVIVDVDPKDSLHSTYVYNRPTLDGPVLRIWNRGDATARFAGSHPDRAVYLFRPAINNRPLLWQLLRPPRVVRRQTDHY